MSEPTTSIRVTVKQRLYDLIAASPPERLDGSAGVQVLYGPNVRELENESIWIGAIEGRSEPAVIAGGPGTRIRRNDSFVVDIWCGVRAPLLDDQQAADNQCAALVAAVEDVLAANPGLGQTGVNTDKLDGVLSAWIEDFNGPSPADLTESGLGAWHSAAVLRIRVNTRLI